MKSTVYILAIGGAMLIGLNTNILVVIGIMMLLSAQDLVKIYDPPNKFMEITDHNLNIKVVHAKDIKVLQTFCPACQTHFAVKFSDSMELNESEVAWVKDKLKKTLTYHKCLIDMRGNKI